MTGKRRVADMDIIGTDSALKRAAKQARRIAEITGTALVIWEDGQVVYREVRDGRIVT